ncbi:MAG: Asp-tRNA(Asn)/Glu-tRNA(Gln) amidotransferase subunit GatB [Acidobacteria bacterium]|nr:Asp-tRNA(Asn)/Glu-tRNA(Gln) amidotransferase subunit GatB [Acidobacteriota bacterium]
MEYQAVIGLEVHAQLLTASKLFCGCSTRFGSPPNSNTCPVCLGLPGALPVLNREAVSMAVRTALALECTVNPVSIFARKNYFYPDLPKGYQISQYDRPLGEHGRLTVLSGERSETGRISGRRRKSFGIRRIHLEEDAGKSVHDGMPESMAKSYIDLNRTGVPLVEIVSEPDFTTSQEAYDYLTQLRKTLLYLGVCDGNMEEGSLRCDANVSVRPAGSEQLGTKVEIKNLNSFRFLQKALDYEISRQIRVLSEGGRVVQETRLWDEEHQSTFPMRSKEEAHDYRYFPEPDLPPLHLERSWLERLIETLPELPQARTERFMSEYGLSDDEALLLTATIRSADYYEACARASNNPRAAFNWMTVELAYALKNSGKQIEECPLAPDRLGELIRKIDAGDLSGKMAKTVFEEMYRSGESPDEIIRRLGLVQLSDESALAEVIDRVIAANPKQAAEFRAGKERVLGYFVGRVMKETKGHANPGVLNALLQKKLRE